MQIHLGGVGAGAFAALALAASAAPAATGDASQFSKGWTFAHWGMTKAQVEAVSGGKAHMPTGVIGDVSDQDVVDGGASVGPFKFDVYLYYTPFAEDKGLLQDIEISLPDGDKRCSALKAYLVKLLGGHYQYGISEAYEGWTWTRGGDVVSLSRMRGYNCEIRVDPPDQGAG